MSLGRRDLGRLMAGLSAVIALTGCGPARAAPTAEAEALLDELMAELSTIDLLTDVDGSVTTHVYTEPDIAVTARTSAEPDRDNLVRIGTAIQAAVDRHQLDGTHVGVTLRTVVKDADLNWHWVLSTSDTPQVEEQVDGCLAEIDLGARSVTLDDGMMSRWSAIDDYTVLRATPPGLRRVTRWISPGRSQDFTVTIHTGEPDREWPVEALVGGIRRFLGSLNLVVMDDWAHWQLSLAIDDESADQFAEAMVDTLRLLRTVDAPTRHTLDCTGPWWVNFAIGSTVSIAEWPPEKVRTVDRAAIQQVVDRANR